MRHLRINDPYYGDGRRLEFQENELRNAPIVPNPVEYEDIDRAVFSFFDENIVIVDDEGERIPTFKLFSNQRFTEYSQTWKHTDKDGNLLMNFKTVSRDINPQLGNLHGGKYNIPGRNRFTVCMREILDDTGVECYEITSMSQPVATDFSYTVSFVCTKIDRLNEFNLKMNQLFQSRQCYVMVNGHYMPMLLDSIGDESRYDVEGRKFFNQSVIVNVMGYVIPKDDIKVELKPKRVSARVSVEGAEKTYVDMDFDTDSEIGFFMNVRFRDNATSVRFKVEDNMVVNFYGKDNANKVRMYVNGDEYDYTSWVMLKADDSVAIFVTRPNMGMPSYVKFRGEIL